MPWLRIWSDLSLRAKGLIVVAVPAAATVAIACASFVIESRGASASRAADREMQIIEASQALQSYETEASAHVRAYFITGDDSFRTEAGRDASRFENTLGNLANLVAANSKQRQEVLRISALHRARVDEMQRAVELFRSASMSKEQLRASTDINETRRREMAGALDAIEADEWGLREMSRQEAVRLRNQLRTATLIFGLLGVVGGTVISLLFAAGITRRIEKLHRNVVRLKTGQPLALLPEGRDEIGALSEGIAIAAEMLKQRTAALENALHGIAQADASGRYVSFNKAFGELTGLHANSAPATVLEGVHPDDQWKVAGALERMRLSGRAETEARIVRAGSGSLAVGVTLLPASETRDSGCYVFLRDITRQKEVEATLVRAKDA